MAGLFGWPESASRVVPGTPKVGMLNVYKWCLRQRTVVPDLPLRGQDASRQHAGRRR